MFVNFKTIDSHRRKALKRELSPDRGPSEPPCDSAASNATPFPTQTSVNKHLHMHTHYG